MSTKDTVAGKSSKRAILPNQVAEITQLRKDGKAQTEIARQFGVSQQAISKLLKKQAVSNSNPSHNGKASGKPRNDFPLTRHEGSRQWCKRINGELYYFGKLDDPGAALRRYVIERDDLYAGRQPRTRRDDATVRYVCNSFLTEREYRVDAGDLKQRTFDDYYQSCENLIKHLGPDVFVSDLGPHDFAELRAKLATGRGPVTLGNEIGRMRCIFNHAYDVGDVERPVRWANSFRKPSKKRMREHRNSQPKKFIEAQAIHDILQICSPQLRAMILLGVNAGLGNSDCSLLTYNRIQKDWLQYPRHKTAVQRSCWLWPETMEAIEAATEVRPRAKDPEHDNLVFITKYGQPWTGKDRACPISQQFRKAAIAADHYVEGVGFYSLRHVCEAIGGETKDQVAVNHLMGHVDETQGEVYREDISDDRIKAVSTTIRRWLFGDDA